MMAENGTQVKKIPMELQPESEFRFRGDFRTAVTIPLKVKNTSSTSALLYKMKTTKPHRYIVKPFKGEVAPASEAVVHVTLLPFHFKSDQRYTDKFLLQVS